MAEISVLPLACAYWTSEGFYCRNSGTKSCSNCRLVVMTEYCGTACQKAHWPEHKARCKSDMTKRNWSPAWDREGRDPPWETGTAATNWQNVFGGSKYLWGNTPAMDVLRLDQNEGLEYRGDLSLLFAGRSPSTYLPSGDMRHVVKTISDLPHNAHQRINVVLNDKEFDVVARNALLLLLAFHVQRLVSGTGHDYVSDAVEAMIHIWYSAFIPSRILSHLQTNIKPLIDGVCDQVATQEPTKLQGKTWEFSSGRSLRLVLKQEHWLQLREYMDVPASLRAEEARLIRTAVTLAPERVDYRDRWYFKDASPFMRIAKQRFREDGLLLPFGHPRLGFDVPNPLLMVVSRTLFRWKSWPMDDKADPINGWAISAIQQSPSPASSDWYGKLFAYLNVLLKRFIERLGKFQISFTLHNVDVRELPQYLNVDRHSRIETVTEQVNQVSNICDRGYIGIRNTLSLLGPYLQQPQQNPQATLITLFINAIKEVMKEGGAESEIPNMQYLSQYIPLPQLISMPSLSGAGVTRFWDARDLAADVETFFLRQA
ncbi:hypothetical protein TOPH_07817 [Tolypocladium ophioglossoides CBS 100239]|uniref:MYND-type domain-containing protein n=1 Tax=Tolypocladium ophioglossoides (strain CBS 100239) TaxID=1163406 RepID=A0A0L0N0J7_TOLOC|nr:hypothetical protein TOPH_07817 [Tolypocladium ophioglossoides CBS 100239]